MKDIYNENLILRVSVSVLIFISLIILPFFLIYFINNNYEILNIILIVSLTTYLYYGIAIAINNFVIRKYFVKVSDSIIVKNIFENYADAGLFALYWY